MNVEIRVYKRYDTDLLALHDCGFSLTKMMKDALVHYANGTPYHLYIDEYIPFDLSDKKSIRVRLSIKNDDMATISLLNATKKGYRSNFCKLILRNALLQQNLVCYLKDNSFMSVQQIDAMSIPFGAIQNVYTVSQYRMQRQVIQVAGITKDVTPQNKGMKKAPMQLKRNALNVSATPMTGKAPQPSNTSFIPQMPTYSAPVSPPISASVPVPAAETPPVPISKATTPTAPATIDTQDAEANPAVATTEPIEDTIKENNELVPGLAGDDDLMKAFDAL